MGRKVFFSFYYKGDNWRAAKVRNIGVVEGNEPVSDNAWEEVADGGDEAIKEWISDQLKNRTCTIVLIGEKTAGRKWIKHEIKESWDSGKGVLGIYIHNLEDRDGNQSSKGPNPFDAFKIDGKSMSSIVKIYDPPYKTSPNVYKHISDNISSWVEKAIQIRGDY